MSESTARPSTWWNCGVCVASFVAPVDAAGDHTVERWRVGLHRARLHGRGVGAQDDVVLDVEGVRTAAGRVGLGVVEGVEVVVDVLDLGPVEDAEAEARKTSSISRQVLINKWWRADRLRRVAGQRDV